MTIPADDPRSVSAAYVPVLRSAPRGRVSPYHRAAESTTVRTAAVIGAAEKAIATAKALLAKPAPAAKASRKDEGESIWSLANTEKRIAELIALHRAKHGGTEAEAREHVEEAHPGLFSRLEAARIEESTKKAASAVVLGRPNAREFVAAAMDAEADRLAAKLSLTKAAAYDQLSTTATGCRLYALDRRALGDQVGATRWSEAAARLR